MTNQLQHQPQQRRAVDVRIPAIEKYAYCLCLHVRPTTIFIAVFKLIRALLFASILLNTEFSMSEQANDLSLAIDDRHKSTTIALHILARIIMASVSAVGIYAVISGRAALLMPLYAMLLVDFFFALPSFYSRDVDSSLADGLADLRNYPNPNAQYARYPLMLITTISMIVKIYFLCVIWKCYRYLRLIELVSPIRLSEIYPHIHQNGPQYPIVRVLGSADSTDLASGHNVAPPPYESIASTMKPPNYEEAIKTSGMLPSGANPSLNQPQQQTVVLSNPTTDQNISTHVINEANVRSTIGGMITDIPPSDGNIETVSTTSTIVARDVVESASNQSHDIRTDSQTNGRTIVPNTTSSNTEVNVVIPRNENGNSSDTQVV